MMKCEKKGSRHEASETRCNGKRTSNEAGGFLQVAKWNKAKFARTMDKFIQCMTMIMLLWLIVICGVYIVKMCNGEISTLLGLTAMGCGTIAAATVIALMR